MQTRLAIRRITYGGIIAAIYVALCLALEAISFGVIQVRLAEALCILPMFTPLAIPALAVGCVISNIIGGYGLYDILIGSAATLIAAVLAYLTRRHKFIAPLGAVVVNAALVGYVLLGLIVNLAPPLYCTLTVGVGQIIACYGLGLPLYFLLKRHEGVLFKNI